MTILVVDDDETNLTLARALLEADGFAVVTAMDAMSTFDVLKDVDPALILMDIQLPGMDGWELTRRLKKNIVTSHIPVIAVTAYGKQGDAERARRGRIRGVRCEACEHSRSSVDYPQAPQALASIRLSLYSTRASLDVTSAVRAVTVLRQLCVERAAHAEFRAHADGAALRFDDPLREREAQSCSLVVLRRARIQLLEFDEQAVEVVLLDADAPILDFDAEMVRALGADPHFDAAAFL